MQMGQPVDPALVEEIKRYEEQQASLRESVSKAAKEFLDLPQVKEKLVEEPAPEEVTTIAESATTESAPEPKPDLITKSVQAIHKAEKELKENSFQQPSVPEPADLKSVKEKIKFLEQWLAKVSATGPGGGAAEIYNVDMPTTLVTTNSYSVGRKDYYVGVNYAGPVTITLPSSVKQGRYIIIKDESGRCSKHPIIVQGNVDNDPQGFILKIDNGGIQMIYRNGWRIV